LSYEIDKNALCIFGSGRTDQPGINLNSYDLTKIWTPDIYLVNQRFKVTGQTLTYLYESGEIIHV